MIVGLSREKSSPSSRIHFDARADEKNRQVCLISEKEKK